MLLDRLRIRGKLALLVIVPLLGVAGLAVPVVVGQVDTARRATAVADKVQLAGQVGTLIQNLQQERLMSIGYLLGLTERTDLVQQSANVIDEVADLHLEYGDDLPAPVRSAVAAIGDLSGTRNGILARQSRPDQVLATFSAIDMALINSLRLVDSIDTGTAEGRQVVALDAVLRSDEGISAGAALMMLVVATRNSALITQHVANLAALQVYIDRFTAFATPEQVDLYNQVANALNSRIGPGFVDQITVDPNTAFANLSAARLFPAVTSLSTLGQFVEKKIVTDVIADITRQRQTALTTAYAVGTLVVLILAVVMLLSVVIARTVAQPLTRLTLTADRVARVTEAELVRVADDESESANPIRLDPVDVSGRDEIGELARAFDRVQSTAARLVERQAASRRNVAQMFGHVGRRTQNLVGRQIALIDRLERQETDPTRLQHLYRLDHVSSRLRRNAGSLVVLSGSATGDSHTAPLPLADVVRLALGEIEDYTRVDVQVRPDVSVTPGVIGDLVLALAELMENGTSFSPPHTRVTVSAEFVNQGIRVTLVDHGIGMPAERIAEENARFTRRERLDLAPSEVLGLFVVGRLARRHDWRVALTPTPGGGVTVHLEINDRLLVRSAGRTEPPVVARARPVPLRDEPGTVAQLDRADLLPYRPRPVSARPATAGVSDLADVTALPRRREAASRVLAGQPAAGQPLVELPTAGQPTAGQPAAGYPAAAVAGVPAPAADAARAAARAAARLPELLPVFDPVILNRATRSLESGQPWDAFATPSRTQTASAGVAKPGLAKPQPGLAKPGLAEPVVWAPGAAEPGVAAPGAAAPGGRAEGRAGRGTLRQRVPGAQLPEIGAGRPTAPPVPADPAVVRALIEEFEAGVRRAQQRHHEDPGTGLAASASPAPGASPRPATIVTATGVAPVAPQPLNRRVPGATLSTSIPPARSTSVPVGHGPGDPDEVRDLINEFESGVARALSEVSTDHRHQEGPT